MNGAYIVAKLMMLSPRRDLMLRRVMVGIWSMVSGPDVQMKSEAGRKASAAHELSSALQAMIEYLHIYDSLKYRLGSLQEDMFEAHKVLCTKEWKRSGKGPTMTLFRRGELADLRGRFLMPRSSAHWLYISYYDGPSRQVTVAS